MADYGKDLAYVHDAGFLDLAEQATPLVADLLAERGLRSGRVVELGSGSGATAAALGRAGFEVIGIDSSRAMVEIARGRAPDARFRVGSWLDAPLPACDAVLAIGEVFNYLGDVRGTKAELRSLFRRVATALDPGGLFVFDLAGPGRVRSGASEAFRTGPDWAILYRAVEADSGRTMERRMTTFRRITQGATYRRAEEVHRLRLWPASEIAALLREAGFTVRIRRAYDPAAPVPGHRVFVARLG